MSQTISRAALVFFLLASIPAVPGCFTPECQKTSDCPGEACVEGNCTACFYSAECGAEEVCSAGACLPRECATTPDCPSGACFDGLCQPCATATDCGGDLVCNAGACVTPECATTADCTMGRACDGGLCVLCTSDAQCGNPASEACHHGACVTRECSDPSHCTGGTVCDMGLCEPCSATLQCPDQLGCTGGVCQPCTMDPECGSGRQCRSGLCVINCTMDADCATPGALGCRSRYQERPCGSDGFCGGSASPWPQETICDACGKAESGCPSGTCDADLRCTCTTTADCPPLLACIGDRCGACSVDSDCACGHYCAAGECHAGCTGDGDCPSGGRCDTGTGRCALCLVDTDCPSGQLCFEDGCSGPCDGQLGGGCAPFVTCNANQRCGGCGSCTFGPPPLPQVSTCP
jgi:hypothetical protein